MKDERRKTKEERRKRKEERGRGKANDERVRKELAKNDGLRKKFGGVFVRIGRKTNYKGYSEETILLSSIIDLETNRKVTDHIWFAFTKGFENAGVKEGMEGSVVEFEARIKEYKKGYVNKALKINNSSVDYKLSNPTRVRLVKGSL